MSTIYLYKSVRTELRGRPSIKHLRAVLTKVAKHVSADARVTIKETEGGLINSAPVTVEAAWTEWA